MLFLYFFKPGTTLKTADPIIARDTVYKTDTVILNGSATGNYKNPAKGYLTPVSTRKTNDTANPYKDVALSCKIISSENNTFGYEILMNGRLYIHQTNIPGLPGNMGFKNKETAKNVANLVISKIRKNEMPPSVTTSELNKLNALQ